MLERGNYNMNEIFKRVSIRKYEDREVEKEKIEMILRAAMAAPSAKNQQPWEFYVVTDKKIIEKLSNCSPYAKFAKNAPLIIVTCYKTEVLSADDYKEVDLAICTENILLEITSLGLGGVWIGIAPVIERMEAVEKVLNIPNGLRAFALVPLGYPMEERHQQDRYDVSRIHYV